MTKAIIVEDELPSRQFLKSMVATFCPDLEVVAEAGNVEEGVLAIQTHQPELVFLDIEMQTGTGFDLLAQFPEPEFDVIFTTAYDHYAIKAIQFSAIAYLLKPIEEEELQQAVKKSLERGRNALNQKSLQLLLQNLKMPKSGNPSITLSTSDGIEFVPLSEIIKIEASGPYSIFYLKEKKKIMVSKNLKEYEQLLLEHGFFRLQNSFIINIHEVKRMIRTDGGYVIMSDASQITISPKKKAEFLAFLGQRLV